MNVNNAGRRGSSPHNQPAKWNESLRSLLRQARVMTLILKHPAVPWPAKLVAGCTVGYIMSPVQLIPSFIPIIGQLDDLAMLLAGAKLLRVLAPPAVLAECKAQAESHQFCAGPPRVVQPEYRQKPSI